MSNSTKLLAIVCYLASALFAAMTLIMLTSCGSVVRSSRHDVVVSGEATITQKIEIDISVCDVFQDEAAKLECVKALMEAFKAKQKEGGKDDTEI